MFKNDGLSFRLAEASDLEAMRVLRNDPTTWINLTDPHPVSEESQRRWLEGVSARPDRMYFVVSDQKHPFIGIVRMDEYDRTNRSIRVGADVVPELRGKGFGRRIFEGILEYCFNTLNIHRVWLAVLDKNEKAKRLYEKQGFSVEGRYREAIFREGAYMDYIIMSILRQEYNR